MEPRGCGRHQDEIISVGKVCDDMLSTQGHPFRDRQSLQEVMEAIGKQAKQGGAQGTALSYSCAGRQNGSRPAPAPYGHSCSRIHCLDCC